MNRKNELNGKHRPTWFFISLALLLVLLLDLTFGSVSIPLSHFWKELFSGEGLSYQEKVILTSFRIPRVVTALLTGSALAVSGLQMQTIFRNPLAGPYVLGISSGASLGAAIVVMGAGSAAAAFLSGLGIIFAAWLGAAAMLLLLLLVSLKIRSVMTILILGMMFGSGLSAIISIMQYFSASSGLKAFVIWSMGSLSNVTASDLKIFSWVIVPALLFSLLSVKTLNGLMLGEEYARSMGVRLLRSRLLVFTLTSLLAGTVTAFCGPIGFVGVAVPHMARFLTGSSDHKILLPASLLLGMLVMTASDLLAQLPGSERILPINAVTSLIGIPVVIWVVVRERKHIEQ